MRMGMGYDVHALVAGRKLILGGIDIPFEKGLLGHSDADVLVHAIMDALLGAAALGDIGTHFPDTDPTYKGASSLELLKAVVTLLTKRGYTLGNIDATLVLQRPKVKDFIVKMCENIAAYAGCSVNAVSVKATTTEGLGFAGKGEGVAAYAVVLVEAIG